MTPPNPTPPKVEQRRLDELREHLEWDRETHARSLNENEVAELNDHLDTLADTEAELTTLRQQLADARADAFEEAAKIAEDWIPMPGNIRQMHGTYANGCFDVAKAIRARATLATHGEGEGK